VTEVPDQMAAQMTALRAEHRSDEINHEAGDIANLFSTYLGEVFRLGGLAGIPFTGKTGFGAFPNMCRTTEICSFCRPTNRLVL